MAVGEQGYSRDDNINECISPRKYLYRIKDLQTALQQKLVGLIFNYTCEMVSNQSKNNKGAGNDDYIPYRSWL